MSSQLKTLAVYLILVLSITVASAQNNVQQMPEPTAVYTCDDVFQPSDLAFDKNGMLYAIKGPQRNSDSVIYHFPNSSCAVMPSLIEGTFSTIATNTDGDICVSDREVKRGSREVLNCWNGKKWHRHRILDRFTFSFGLSFSSEDMWLAHDRFFEPISVGGIESGGISYFKNGKLVATWMRPTDTIARQPNFVVAATDKAIFTELNSKQESDFSVTHINGSVVEIDANGVTRILKDDFDVPTGITLINDFIVVADYARGELYQLDLDGNTKAVYTGLEGPAGIKQSPNGDLCIAEMLGGRISCYSLASLGLE